MHECSLSRAIGYYLEPLIVLGLFAKKPLNITLKGTAFITVNLLAVYFFIYLFFFGFIFCCFFIGFLVKFNV